MEFRGCVESRSAALLRLAYLLAADRCAAEDVLQIALVRTYLRWRRISSDPERYVRRVLVTGAADERGRSHHRPALPSPPLPDGLDPDPPPRQLAPTDALHPTLPPLPP